MKSFYTENSSQVRVLTYDEDRLELTVEFRRGGIYVYSGVPEDIYISLITAESIGKALNALVKGTYGYTRK